MKSYLIPLIKLTFVFVCKFLFSLLYPGLGPQLVLNLIIPYLLLIFLALRLLQFITHNGDTYKNVTQFKYLIRICLFIALFIVQSDLSSDFASYRPHQDWFPLDVHKLSLHLSKKNYILVRYFFSFGVYFLVHQFGTKQAYDRNNLHALQALTEIIDCLVIFWEDDIFSLDQDYSPCVLVEERRIGIQKILVAVLVSYDLFISCTEVVLCYGLRNLFKRSSGKPYRGATSTLIDKLLYRKHLVYFVNGTKNIFCFLFSLVVFKLTQTILLGTEVYGEISKRWEKCKDFEDSSYNILFLFLILWIIKTIVFLAWESNIIYDRLRSRMLSVREELYFLSILDSRNQKAEDESLTGWYIESQHGVTAKKRWRNKIRDELLWNKYCDPTLDDLQQVAQHILRVEKNLSHNYFSAILSLVDTKRKNRNIRETLQQLISWGNEYKEDGDYFDRVLLKINADMGPDKSLVSKKVEQKEMKVVYLTDFRTWLEKAHDEVISVANTLTGAKEVTEGLNKVVSVFLIGATIMAWLKAIKIVEVSKDFALILGPFVAATFLIKDTLKDLFVGIFFVLFIHPFDIGDLCLIDGKNKMEVAAMGLWTTTFLAIDEDGNRKFPVKKEEEEYGNRKRHQVIYPNSELAKVKIIKLKHNFIGITR